MLYEFVTEHRDEIISLCRAKVAARLAPRATKGDLEQGVPLFLDQLIETLRLRLASSSTMEEHATRNGNDLLRLGVTVAQVVHSYGDVCQAITQLALELDYAITTDEFCRLNRCLDDAIADSVTEYERQHDEFVTLANTQSLGRFSHELRNLIHSAGLAFEAISTGGVGISGGTGAALGRSLASLRDLVDRSIGGVKLETGVLEHEPILVGGLIEDVATAAALDARARGLTLTVPLVERGIGVMGDRRVLTSAVANLLQNAFKFTKPLTIVSLSVRLEGDRVLISIEDECGGLPPGAPEDLFKPFEQRSADRTGMGLGLSISRRAVESLGGRLDARDLPGIGCIFTIDLPTHPEVAA